MTACAKMSHGRISASSPWHRPESAAGRYRNGPRGVRKGPEKDRVSPSQADAGTDRGTPHPDHRRRCGLPKFPKAVSTAGTPVTRPKQLITVALVTHLHLVHRAPCQGVSGGAKPGQLRRDCAMARALITWLACATAHWPQAANSGLSDSGRSVPFARRQLSPFISRMLT